MATETLVPNKDEDGQDQEKISNGLRRAEDWANGKLVTVLEEELLASFADISETDDKTSEGGKALYGTFSDKVKFAGGLSIHGMRRGHNIVRYRNGRQIFVGRQTLRVFPGGR